MLGLLYTAIVSIGALAYKANRSKENKENKIKFRHPDGLTYVDITGRSRLLSTDEIVFYTYDNNGDYVLKNISGHVYRNFSEEKRIDKQKQKKEEALERCDTTYCIDDNDHRKDWNCKGKRFKDFKTGDVYVIRCINYTYWYLNIETGMIVRKTDWQLKHDEEMKKSPVYKDSDLYEKIYHVDVDALNEKRKGTQDKWEFYLDYKYNLNCNMYK